MTEPREYRGKRIDNGEWVEGDLYRSWVQTNKNNGGLVYEIRWQVIDENGEKWNEHEEVDPSTVGQYTGADAKGDQFQDGIYDGDSCEITTFFDNGKAYEKHIGKVIWHDYGWYFKIDDEENGDWYLPFKSAIIDFTNVRIIHDATEGVAE